MTESSNSESTADLSNLEMPSDQQPRQRFVGANNPYVNQLRSGQQSFVMNMDDATAALHRPGAAESGSSPPFRMPIYFEQDPRLLEGDAQPQMIINGRRINPEPDADAPTREEAGGDHGPSSILSGLLQNNPEAAVVVKSFEKYIPFALIIAAKGFFDHATGIFVFMALFVTFYHANSVLKREISRQSRRSVWPILAVLVNLSACMIFIHFVFNDARLYKL